MQLPEEREDFYQGHHHLAPFVDAGGTDLKLELHTSPFPDNAPFELPLDEMWDESRVLELGERRIRVFSQGHQLVHLCVHLAWSHGMQSSSWRTFRDIHAMDRKYPIDWEAFADLANRVSAGTSAYWTLRLARSLTGFPVTDEVLERLQPELPEMVLRRLEKHFADHLLPLGQATCPSVSLTRKLWEMGMQPDQSGHHGVRPWMRDDIFLQHVQPDGRTFREKMTRHRANLADWVAYGRRILVP